MTEAAPDYLNGPAPGVVEDASRTAMPDFLPSLSRIAAQRFFDRVFALPRQLDCLFGDRLMPGDRGRDCFFNSLRRNECLQLRFQRAERYGPLRSEQIRKHQKVGRNLRKSRRVGAGEVTHYDTCSVSF